jgi:DNA alkylation repair enzyme
VALTPASIAAIARETVAETLAPGRAGVPEAREIRRRLSGRLKSESGGDVLAVGLAIASAPEMKAARARWVGWELIVRHKAAVSDLDLAMVMALGAGNSSWDEVDGYGLYIAGPAWLRGLITDEDVLAWTKSPDLWRRRAALVSTVVLNSRTHGGAGDARRTLMIADALAGDHQDMVVKALSWAVRTLVQWDRTAVEEFLARHDGLLAARVKREVRTKLRTGKKNAGRPA